MAAAGIIAIASATWPARSEFRAAPNDSIKSDFGIARRNQRNQMKKTMIIPALALLCSISAVAMAQKLKPD
jgi:hypothetical protein